MWKRRRALDGLDDDIRDHLEREIEEHVARGRTREEARRQALLAFGDPALVREDARAVWDWRWVTEVGQDLRYAVRSYARTPALAAVVIGTLALGIGANTAIFSVLDAVVLRPLPVREPDRLVELLSRYPGEPRMASFGWSAYEHYRDNNRVLSDLIAVGAGPIEVRPAGGAPEAVEGSYVTGNYFSALGLAPALGRLLDAQDDSDPAVAVLSWAYWQRRFGGDTGVPGRSIVVNDAPVTIVGVAPREFTGLLTGVSIEVWMPAQLLAQSGEGQRVGGPLLMGRLAPGVSRDRAQADLRVLDRWRVEELARSSGNSAWLEATLELESGRAGFSPVRDAFGSGLEALMLLVGVLLAIACINVAGLLLTRGMARRQEVAVRVALGAGRLRLLRQMLAESVLLAASGGVLGVLLAYVGAELLVDMLVSSRPLMRLPGPLEIPVEPDGRVLLFAVTIAVATGVLSGLAPACTAATTAPAVSLRGMGQIGERRSWRVLRNGLVVGQMALSVALLSATGLLVGHLARLQTSDLGFARDGRLLVRLDPSETGYSRQELGERYDTLLARLEGLPAIRSVTLSAVTPIQGGGAARFINVEGVEERPADRRYMSLNWVAPRYFETLGTPLVAGRDFQREDAHAQAPPVAIVNQALARRYFADRTPLGQRFTFDESDRVYEIVGVVGDAKYVDLRQPAPPTIYLNALQEGRGTFAEFSLHTRAAPMAALPAVRDAVRQVLGEDARVDTATTMADQIDATLVPERLTAWLSTAFGALGAGLAALGLYGQLAYAVARRAREIGLRTALGATRAGVTAMVLKSAGLLVGVGLVLGVPAAIVSTRLAAGILDGQPPNWAWPIAAAAVLMMTVALLATALPARGATRIDPATTLRAE